MATVSERKYTRLGAELRAARKERGWSLRQMAGLLGCEHQRIILWEKGANCPRKSYRDLLTVLFARKFDWSEDENGRWKAGGSPTLPTAATFVATWAFALLVMAAQLWSAA